jgi:hypothetical protein
MDFMDFYGFICGFEQTALGISPKCGSFTPRRVRQRHRLLPRGSCDLTWKIVVSEVIHIHIHLHIHLHIHICMYMCMYMYMYMYIQYTQISYSL